MFFTRFLKGIPEMPGFGQPEASTTLRRHGIKCNWWHNQDPLPWVEAQQKFTEDNLLWHLSRYSQPLPGSTDPFSKQTPFISTTTGTVERFAFLQRNIILSARDTAVLFATDFGRRPGFVFSGYVMTLGRQTIPFLEFAEEVRNLHIYTMYLPYHPEGEVVAKIHIPAHRIECVEYWTLKEYDDQLDRGVQPLQPIWHDENPDFSRPEAYVNITDLL